MKVICINNENFEHKLTIGQEYNVFSVFKRPSSPVYGDAFKLYCVDGVDYYKSERFVEVTENQ